MCPSLFAHRSQDELTTVMKILKSGYMKNVTSTMRLIDCLILFLSFLLGISYVFFFKLYLESICQFSVFSSLTNDKN